jgi:hypothetical protein
MSATQTAISFRHVFGISANVADNVSFTDDDTVVYVAGTAPTKELNFSCGGELTFCFVL